MSTDTAYAVVMLIAVAINYTTLFIVLPRNYSLRVSISISVIYTLGFYAVLYLTGNLSNMLGGFRGLIHLPLMIFLFRGQFFQKLFATLMVMIFSGFQMSLVSSVVGFFSPAGSHTHNLIASVITLAVFAAYITFVFFFGRRALQKLFIRGQQMEWALYSLGAVLSFTVMMFANNTFTGAGHIIVITFTVWSFVILCFAIINTHEKFKQAYEAEFARDIISTGSGHYLKMNEMYDALRTLRHDYKYHLDTVSELLSSGNNDEVEKYLDDIKKQLAEKELPNFCSNAVLNALLASYAERCSKLNIKYSTQISLPDSITVPNYEMCIVLGNLLENAVEACIGQDSETRAAGHCKVELAIKTQGANLAIMVRNSFSGEVVQVNDRILSKKKDGGLGLRSVQAVATRHGGELMTEWDNKTFMAYVLMRV